MPLAATSQAPVHTGQEPRIFFGSQIPDPRTLRFLTPSTVLPLGGDLSVKDWPSSFLKPPYMSKIRTLDSK